MARRRRNGQSGFTIVEVLVALSIFLLILMGIMQVFEPSNSAYQSSQRKLNVQQNGRVAMDVMVRQIRMAGYFPENIDTDNSNDQQNSVEVATNAAIAVAGDLDGSGSTNAFFFCLDSAGLRRVQGPRGAASSYTCSNGVVLAEGVTNLGFAYYDANNDPVPDPPTAPYQLDGQGVGAAPSFASPTQRAAVRRVVITLTARESVPNQPPQTYTLTSDVRLRNP
ncbi:MAG TPA: prepilin-type N-terminal cleavage/methylation domain-containing protein [Methylomirabilota bacterium]|jgi:type IV pilus assembly protein PilW